MTRSTLHPSPARSRGGRKVHYAHVLVDALDLQNVPRPLDAVLSRV